MTAALPDGDDVPAEIAEAVAFLTQLDDARLWERARSRLADKALAELQSLHFKQQRVGLTRAERTRADDLCLQYDRTLLIRARAAALLKERGHDVSILIAKP
jgi:hypothetical protein